MGVIDLEDNTLKGFGGDDTVAGGTRGVLRRFSVLRWNGSPLAAPTPPSRQRWARAAPLLKQRSRCRRRRSCRGSSHCPVLLFLAVCVHPLPLCLHFGGIGRPASWAGQDLTPASRPSPARLDPVACGRVLLTPSLWPQIIG
ncbi:unnamed protein product [Phaeothamnion confervicola]